jgi:predicted aspartyl protease
LRLIAANLALFAWACLATQASATGLANEVALQPTAGLQRIQLIADNRPAVSVFVNGRGPFVFLIDTAASHTVITPVLRDQLALTPSPGPAVTVVTAAGTTRSRFYSVGTIETAGVGVREVQAIVVDAPPGLSIAGTLGANFLSKFVMDLNVPARTISFNRNRGAVDTSGLRQLKGRLIDHILVVVPAFIDGIATEALMDTGGQYTVGNPQLRYRASRRRGGLNVVATDHRIVDAVRQREFAEAYYFDQVTVGPASWRDVRVLIADMRVFRHIGLNDKPAVFVGMDLISSRRLVIDYFSASLWISP